MSVEDMSVSGGDACAALTERQTERREPGNAGGGVGHLIALSAILAAVVAGAVAVSLAAGAGARVPAGGPTCSHVASVDGDVGSFLRVPTCRPYFAGGDRYRPARFRLVAGSLPPGLSL